MDAPHIVQQRLEEIDRELEQRQNYVERYAKELARAKHLWEKKHAEELLKRRDVSPRDVRDAETKKALYEDKTYGKFLEAEAGYEGLKAVIRVLETRASIGQSILKMQTRTGPNT